MIKIHSNRFFTTTGIRSSKPIHALTIPTTTTIFRKCSIVVIPTKWASFGIDVAVAEKLDALLSPANPVFVFPVQKDIPTDGQILSADG